MNNHATNEKARKKKVMPIHNQKNRVAEMAVNVAANAFKIHNVRVRSFFVRESLNLPNKAVILNIKKNQHRNVNNTWAPKAMVMRNMGATIGCKYWALTSTINVMNDAIDKKIGRAHV